MGAISKYKKRLVGKYFYFRFCANGSDYIDVIGKIKSINPDKDYKGLLIATYSLVFAMNDPHWHLSAFSSNSEVDEECVVFDKMGKLKEFFELFFNFGGSDV